MLLFTQRLCLSYIQYTCITQAGILLTQTQNSLLFWGIRFFFLATPLLVNLGQQYSLCIAIFSLLLGTLLWLSSDQLLGVLILAFGLSIANFLVKQVSAQLPSKSAWNKVAINFGALLVGLLLQYCGNKSEKLLTYMLLPIIIVWILSLLPAARHHICIQSHDYLPLTAKKTGWLLLGMIAGLRVFGIYTILSIHLKQHDALHQYASFLSIYSLMTILLQTPAIFKKNIFSLRITISALLISICIMNLHEWFAIHIFFNGIIWLSLLTLEESFAPYIDYYANKANALFYKEIGISIGGALCPILFTYNHLI